MKLNFITILLLLLSTVVFSQRDTTVISDSTKIYYIVDSMPQMSNGEDINTGLFRIFRENFIYPDSLDCSLITYIVFEFTISSTGKIKDENIRFRGNYPDCEDDYNKLKKAGTEFFKKLPMFTPGKNNGKPVDVRFVFPVHIHLQ